MSNDGEEQISTKSNIAVGALRPTAIGRRQNERKRGMVQTGAVDLAAGKHIKANDPSRALAAMSSTSGAAPK